MFVQIAEDLKVDADAKTLRLVKVGQQTLYFSDRPVRLAGHIKMSDYLEEWTEKAGKDNFGAVPQTPRYPSMSLASPRIRLLWLSSRSLELMAPISSTPTNSSKASFRLQAAQPHCSSIG